MGQSRIGTYLFMLWYLFDLPIVAMDTIGMQFKGCGTENVRTHFVC